MRRVLLAGLALWILRWAAIQLAAYAGRHWLPPSPPPKDSPRQPGRIPGPFERPY